MMRFRRATSVREWLRLSFVVAASALAGCGGPGVNAPADISGGGAGGSNGGSSLGAAIDATEPAMHCLAAVNAYRVQYGAAPLVLDDELSTFSMMASQALEAGGPAHGFFNSAGSALWQDGFCSSAAENQAPGWSIAGDEDATIDSILAQMMAEGPTGGHFMNIVAQSSTRLGVGLVVDGSNQLWFTNDFSASCH